MRCRRMMFPASICIKSNARAAPRRRAGISSPVQPGWCGLTTVAHKPSITSERVTSSYSFRFPELSQPI
jgi:hypothetical protein